MCIQTAGKKDVKKSPKKSPQKTSPNKSPQKTSPKKSPKKASKNADDEEWVYPSVSVVEDSTVTEAENFAKSNPPNSVSNTVCETKY